MLHWRTHRSLSNHYFGKYQGHQGLLYHPRKEHPDSDTARSLGTAAIVLDGTLDY